MDIGMTAPEDLKGSAEEAYGILVDQNSQGSGGFKPQRSTSLPESWRPIKVPKADAFCIGQSMGLVRSGLGISTNSGQTMISFSSQPQISPLLNGDGVKSSAFPFALSSTEPLCSRTASYNAQKSGAGTRGAFSRFRGPFTPSQWMELEHQAMIYKYFISNIPVPSQLLIPLRKAFNPFGLSSLCSGSYASNPLGWGSFHLGFGGSSDPEPGRCRRTDGKKWRCSRDAVPDQKYCDKHINRGRHRSRKPVEGQLGHAVSGSTVSKVAPNALSSSLGMSTSSASNSLGPLQHQFKSLEPNAPNGSTDHLANRLQDLHGLPSFRDIFELEAAKEAPLSSQKQHAEFGGSMSEFGLVSPDSLLNPSHISSCRNSGSLLASDDQEENDQHPLRRFIDNWPEDQSNQPSPWPGEVKLDWTELSMSIPVSSSDFSSSSNSPQLERPKLSPPKLSCELDSPKLGLNDMNGPNQGHANWAPVAWEDSLGGPLGEALNTAPSIDEILKSSSALDFVTDEYDNHPQFGCFPAGILPKSTFVSLLNSGSGNNLGAGNDKAPHVTDIPYI